MEKYKLRYKIWKDSKFPEINNVDLFLVIPGLRLAQEVFARYGFAKTSGLCEFLFWMTVAVVIVSIFINKEKYQKKEYDRIMKVMSECDLK